MIASRAVALFLLVLSVRPAGAAEIRCESDALREPMKNLALATGEKAPQVIDADCEAQLRIFVQVANAARTKLSQLPSRTLPVSSTGIEGRRLALAAVLLSALALLSAPITTILLFRRYGLISWRLYVGDSTSGNRTK